MTDLAGPAFHGTEMGRVMAALDWTSTPLGAPHTWPEILRRTLQMMLTSKQQMVLFWGPHYVALYNDAYYPVIGAKHPGALGRPVREHWGELLHVLIPLLDQVVETGEAFWAHDHPFPLRRRGFVERTYFDISYDPVPLCDGLVGGVLCLVTETTGRVLSQRRMRTLSELGVAATAVLQPDEVAREVVLVLARNPDDVPFAQLYRGESGLLHRAASTLTDPGAGPELIIPGDGTAAGTAVAEVLATGSPVSAPATGFAGRRVPPDVEPEIEVALVLPITGGSGVAGVLVVGVNPLFRLPGPYREFYDVLATTVSASIANAMSHEQERRRVAELAELDRAKTEFFSNVSHEFRTPLTLIAGPADDALADQDDPLSPGQRQRLEIVRRNAGRLRRLVDDLLDVARIEAGRLQADTVALDLAQTTCGIAESFAPAVERAGLRMWIDCPPLDRPVVVDPEMWEKILLNLLSNALKYTHEGEISVLLRSLGDQVELTVADTGVGIPADQLPLLFQRFHRVRGAGGRSHEGTGIGLALVHELIRLHDGEVIADSTPGQGSTFTVRLPCGGTATTTGTPKRTSMLPHYLDEAMQWTGRPGDAQAPGPDAGAAEPDDRVVPRVAASVASVLIAEDNADLRAFLTTLLAPSYDVISTADGRAALKEISRQHPDLVLADVTMPELDGFELLAALRADPHTAAIPVILLSARAGADAAVEGLTAGADDYLVKPFSAPDLLARVRSNLELSRLRNHESAWRIALVNAVQDGLLVTTTDGTVIELNDAFTALLGYGPEGLPYRAPHPWWPDADLEPDAFQQVNGSLVTVQASGHGRFVVPLRHRDGHRVWMAVAVASVRDRDGLQQLFVATHRDVTAEQVSAERRSALSRFAERLGGARGVREVFDVGLAEFRDRWGVQRAFAACWGSDGRLELLAGDGIGAPDAAGLDPEVHAAITAARHSGELQISTGRAGVAVPAAAGGCPVVLWLAPGRRLASGDLDRALLRGLCDQLAVAYTRARAFDDQRSVAITLQRSILGPTDLPPGFAVRYEPAAGQLEVGGDWYDVVSLGGSRVGVVVGDCVGRGLGAAAVMGQLRSACRALLLQPGHPPGQVLAALDDFAELIPEAHCTTLFCATLDLITATVRYSSAGHPPGLLVHADGSSELLDVAQSVPLATVPAPRRPEAGATLRPGSTLLLYTDGLIENRREPLARGTQRARDAVLRFRGLGPEPLAGQLAGTLLGNGHEDDVAYVIYQHPRRAVEPFTAVLPGEPGLLGPLRRSLQAWLATTVASDRSIDEIVLAVSEACANAIEHAAGSDPDRIATVTGTATGEQVELEITDDGSWKPPVPGSGDRGRGLLLMNRMMDDVTISAGDSGTTVRLRKGL